MSPDRDLLETAKTSCVGANGIDINVATAGSGPAVVLLHGFPHTWQVWQSILPTLAQDFQVIAPDLRGMGGSSRAADGYDVLNLEADLSALLDALDISDAAVVGVDAGGPPAFMHALLRSERVRSLVMIESLVGLLPGAEEFLAAGPPWWFGFHSVPDLAETIVEGHEEEYVDFFLRIGTTAGRGPDSPVRDEFVAAYTGRSSLRCAFKHYRAMAESAAQIASAVESRRLTVPTMAIGAQSVGDALHRQLAPISDDLTDRPLPRSGHIVPLDRPEELLAAVRPFLLAQVS